MALFHCNFYSSTLYMNTDLYIIIPTMISDELLNKKRFDYFQPGAKYQTLYLLHGAYGDILTGYGPPVSKNMHRRKRLPLSCLPLQTASIKIWHMVNVSLIT